MTPYQRLDKRIKRLEFTQKRIIISLALFALALALALVVHS